MPTTLARQALRFLYRDPEINWIFYFICPYFFKAFSYVFFHSIDEYAVDGIDGSPLVFNYKREN